MGKSTYRILADVPGMKQFLLQAAAVHFNAQSDQGKCRHRMLTFVAHWKAPEGFKTPSFDLYNCKVCHTSLGVRTFAFPQLV